MLNHTVFIFANLKPSQIFYKVLPLSKSTLVKQVIILRKEFIDVGEDKIICKAIPKFFRIRPFYWMFVPFYGIYLVKKYHVTLILNYNIFPHGFNAFIASLLTKRPVIFAEINEDTIRYHKKQLTRPLIKAILSNAAYITVPGSRTKSYWKRNGYFRLATLHSTINTEVFKPNITIRKSYDFIFIGEFDTNKRPDIILEAFNALRKDGINATICMIGFGSLLRSLKEKIDLYGLDSSVSLITTNNVLEYLQRSRIFVMASLSEGIPCSLMESMACELIPIVPNVGDIPDVVQLGYNGIIYDGSPTNLCNWMKSILLQYDNLKNMRTNARNTIIAGHSYTVAVSKWDNLLKGIS